MIVYILRRLLWLPVLLIAVSFLTFVLGLHGPGDPCQVRLGQHVNPEALARCRHQEGLDRPLVVQYMDYVRKALHGDLGLSLKYQGQPVGRLIAKRLWVTVQLNMVALSLGMVVGWCLPTYLYHRSHPGLVPGRAAPSPAPWGLGWGLQH